MHFKVCFESSFRRFVRQNNIFQTILQRSSMDLFMGWQRSFQRGITSSCTLSSPKDVDKAEVIDFHLLFSSPLVLVLFESEDNSPPFPPALPPWVLPQNTLNVEGLTRGRDELSRGDYTVRVVARIRKTFSHPLSR